MRLSSRIPLLLLAGAALAAPPASAAESTAPAVRPAGVPAGWVEHRKPSASPSAAYRWVDVILEAAGREVSQVGARPTIISRQMVIPLTALFEAWAAYDGRAVGPVLGGTLRRPTAERTRENQEKAIAYATYGALLDLFPKDAFWLGEKMREMGFDPDDASTAATSPQGVGRAAAAAVVAERRHDGANQLGDEVGSNGQPYSDYTFYEPRNPIDRVLDPDRWQPIPFEDGKGGTFYPGFLTPHWYRVKPLVLERGDRFRPPPPPKVGSREIQEQTDECIAFNRSLTLEQKSIVEFMRDGPRSTGQSGHWLQFAQDVSRRDRYGLDADVKLFFAIAGTAFDSFIAAWDAKRVYDSARPWGLVRTLYAGREIEGYLGPGRGFGKIPAERWHPYSPATFVTPPFPGYPSGHSTVSGGCSKMLELITGSDRFGTFERHMAGEWTEPGFSVRAMQGVDGAPAEDLPEDPEVVLKLPTFSATAEMAGISRVMGGYHIQADNVEGLALGRRIAEHTWPKYQALFEGRSEPASQRPPRE